MNAYDPAGELATYHPFYLGGDGQRRRGKLERPALAAGPWAAPAEGESIESALLACVLRLAVAVAR